LDVTLVHETDLERVERAIARVSSEVMQDQSLAAGVITAPKSIGVTAMGVDGIHVGIIVRTRPGQQFKVRAVMFSRLKSAFDADRIRFFGQTPTSSADTPEWSPTAAAAGSSGKPPPPRP
jgi:hypothetical protein